MAGIYCLITTAAAAAGAATYTIIIIWAKEQGVTSTSKVSLLNFSFGVGCFIAILFLCNFGCLYWLWYTAGEKCCVHLMFEQSIPPRTLSRRHCAVANKFAAWRAIMYQSVGVKGA